MANQIVGMVVSLQCLACVSPVCEWPVVAMVTGAVGKGHIDGALVIKVGQIILCLLCPSCYPEPTLDAGCHGTVPWLPKLAQVSRRNDRLSGLSVAISRKGQNGGFSVSAPQN